MTHMTLAQVISQATAKELKELAAYVAGEVGLEGALAEDAAQSIDPEAVVAAMRAWAFMQMHQRDGDA